MENDLVVCYKLNTCLLCGLARRAVVASTSPWAYWSDTGLVAETSQELVADLR